VVVDKNEIQAYADGVLPEARRAAVEAWLAEQPEEAESVEVYRRAREHLRAAYDPVLSEPLPPRLGHLMRRPARWPRYALVTALLALGILAGWQIPAGDTGARMVHRAAVAHATYGWA